MAKHQPEPSVIPFPAVGSFERKLRRQGVLIECRCIRCGFRFIGSVTHKLPTIESIHDHECTSRKAQREASNSDCRTPKVRKAHA